MLQETGLAEREQLKIESERAVLAAVRLPGDTYDERDPFGELASLAEQAGAVVVGTLDQHRQKPEAGTYIGSGKLEELKNLCEMADASTVIFDHELSPKQIAAIERHVERKVLDRSEVILDIFASRATTHEAKLQVEIAQLEYTYPRLRAMWSHLERIVGGAPGGVGTRGPGEQQLEIDRRLVQRRKSMLARELREIQDRKRRSVMSRNESHLTVGLVGYTNAGKSTLFNTLTRGGAYADDRVFATLMTRTREWDLGGGSVAMLSDTVGFVRDLPHNLVASFRATLEEATHADVLLVVLDVSDASADLQYREVMRTLDELFEEVQASEERESKRGAGRRGETFSQPERLVLLNKVDQLKDNRELLVWRRRLPDALAVSAIGGPDSGLDALGDRLRRAVLGQPRDVTLSIPLRESRAISVLESRGEVLEREYTETGEAVLRLRIGARLLEQVRASAPGLRVLSRESVSPGTMGWKNEGGSGPASWA
ncbi:MAG: GTPase HflX [Planctomycetota bacterium]